jgi:enoyl-CoA hydratase
MLIKDKTEALMGAVLPAMGIAMSDGLQISKQGDALVITFARPKARNPLSTTILLEISSTLDALNGINTLIFTGMDDVFASGADLREIKNVGAGAAEDFALRGQRLMSRIAGLKQTTIAAINGYCFGGGLDLALACDRRIASPTVSFAHPGSGLGIITGWGGTQRLPRLIGTANALEMFFTAAPIDAARALSIGLLDAITADPLAAALSSDGL